MHKLSIVRGSMFAAFCLILAPAAHAQPGVTLPPKVLQQMQGEKPGMQAPAAAGKAGSGPAIAGPTVEPMLLTDTQLQGLFAAVKELQAQGKNTNALARIESNDPRALAQGMQASAEVQSTIKKHGFKDFGELQRVAYNAALAHMVAEKGGKAAIEGELKEAEAQQAQALEQMRQHMSAEQVEALKAQMGAGMTSTVRNVPDANVTLIKKYGTQMQELNQKKK